ncbi:protein EARLY FLOWERING 3-like isoform X2 [Salvia miltiorrhiza]|uniref:protein EARLY FLOWERING 3-like isoform X2 n=1 Tax=Salvia miltiorrhiza TaxID=226208 RepID=UPI0025ACEAB0|nr:protein EARLY FLOWERING 3-like isoform X2 [Salvia miltiorrhiza]
MKRGKDEAKITGPMFPRLHVNDTEKGGPRAPPRNKMALYEQLSIPSQRFSHSVPPQNSNSEHELEQGVANERSTFFSYQLPTRHPSEKLYSQFSDFVTPLTQEGQKKKSDEEDFRVPIFNHSVQSRECGKNGNDVEQEKVPLSNPSDAECPSKFHKYRKQVGKSQTEENSKETATDRVSNSSSIARAEGLKKKTDTSVSREPRDTPANTSVEPDVHADSEHARNRRATSALAESSAALDETISHPSRDQRNSRDMENEARPLERSFRSVPMRNLERADSVSEISVMDSIATVDMTPDDVVGVIGQKHFWKARKAILNQQRVFSVQVFELHRLVKVQKSIAESPQLLLDHSDFIEKPTMKVFTGAKIALPGPVKAIPNVSKQISEPPEKPCLNKETSAENTTGRASFSSIQNDVPPPSCRPATGNSPAPSLNSNPNAVPWCFNQPPGHQWLIPVMTPSEGLVYKPYPGPYPGPGFVGPTCGGGGPPGPNPAMGSFMTPPYGMAAPHPHPHYQPPPFPPSGPSGYFPTYGMLPIMNAAAMSNSSVEQMNPRPIPSQASAGEASVGVQHQNVSSTPPRHKKRAFTDGTTSSLHVSRDAEPVRAFTDGTSSPVERLQDSRGSNDAERANELPLFPTAPSSGTRRCSPARPEPDRPTQVIKVVPHNARSATESAARIFQSIQEERKQYDFV